jgi:roadblock/LC7 domain-containing protein
VTLPYTLLPGEDPSAVLIYYITADGTPQTMNNSRYENGQVIFTTNHFSAFMIGYNPVSFIDIAGHWGKDSIVWSGARKLVSGYPEGDFKPDDSTTRAEFIQMLYNALNLKVNINQENAVYTDVTSEMWFYGAVSAMKQAGLLEGIAYSDGSLKPGAPITRQEMAVILTNLAAVNNISKINNVKASQFTDYTDIEYIYAVETAINAGFLNEFGMADGTFSPKSYVTRAQAAKIQSTVVRVLGRS